jgi:hypothetical protein
LFYGSPLSSLQEPATGPYPKPDTSNPHLLILLHITLSNVDFCVRLGPLVVSFLLVSQSKFYMHFSSLASLLKALAAAVVIVVVFVVVVVVVVVIIIVIINSPVTILWRR